MTACRASSWDEVRLRSGEPNMKRGKNGPIRPASSTSPGTGDGDAAVAAEATRNGKERFTMMAFIIDNDLIQWSRWSKKYSIIVVSKSSQAFETCRCFCMCALLVGATQSCKFDEEAH